MRCHHARDAALSLAAGGLIATVTLLGLAWRWLRDIDLM